MNIKLIRATEKPEELVCTAARNDYRSEGVINYTFEELVDDVDVDTKVANDLAKERTTVEKPEKPEDLPSHILIEAKKRSLIKHLIRSGHYGVFEHPQATIAIEGVTRVSMAQLTRHRNFTFDVMSLRYVEIEEDTPDIFDEPPEDTDEDLEELWWETTSNSLKAYSSLIENGLDKEEARKLLGMGIKVNMVVSGNARAWMHLINIRGKGNVQGEAREIANGVFRELSDWMPYTFEYFDKQLPLKLTP